MMSRDRTFVGAGCTKSLAANQKSLETRPTLGICLNLVGPVKRRATQPEQLTSVLGLANSTPTDNF